jgi:hypothetical protein
VTIAPTPIDLAARLAQPIAYQVRRYQCPHCRRFARSKPAPVADHMTRCWLNPAVRACKTCTHHHQEAAEPDVGLDGFEWCDAQDIQLDGICTGCPLWAMRSAS